MYIAMGGERAEQAPAPGARPARQAGQPRRRRGRRRSTSRRRSSTSPTASGSRYDYLVLATGSRIVPEAIEHFDDRGPPLLHRRGRARAARGARRVHGRPDRHRHRGHALQVPAGAARGRVPDRGRAPRARPARARASSTSARRSGARSRSRACPRWRRRSSRQKGIELHTFFNVEAIDPERQVVQSLEGEELPYDLLILVPPHKGAAVPDRLGPGAGAGRLAADRPGDAPGRRPAERLRPRRRDRPAAVEGRLDGPLRGTGRDRADRRRDRGPRGRSPSAATTSARSCASSRSATARARCSSSTTSIRHGRRSRTSSGTWARSCSTRRTGTRCRRAGSDDANVEAERPPVGRPTALVADSRAVDAVTERVRTRGDRPEGQFLTYGVGVSLTEMRNPAVAGGHVSTA